MPAVPKEDASSCARVAGFSAFAVADDGVAKRRWMWMIDDATWERKGSASIGSTIARSTYTFSCGVLGMAAVSCRMLIPSETETARSAVNSLVVHENIRARVESA